MKRALLFAGVALLLAAAQPDIHHTYGMLNGQGFSALSESNRLAYLEGLKDAWSTLALRTQKTACADPMEKLRTDYQVPLPPVEYLGQIERFYAVPANRAIAVADAVELFIAEMRNVPAAAIEQRLRDHRAVAAQDDHRHE